MNGDINRRLLRKLKNSIRHIPYRGNGRFCPICQKSSSKFGKAGLIPREDAKCRYCGAVERHRLTWLYFERMTDLFNGRSKKMLHVAPETVFEDLLAPKLKDGYLTADLYDPNVMVKMDITDIQCDDETFDVIYCSHVLEHVPDDRKAMREFFRVLKSTGWAVLLVPITAEETFEDLSVTDPDQRLKLFGQEDHVRRYGRDYKDRLQEAGFHVDTIYPSDFLSKQDIRLMGITEAAGEIYYCTKK